MASRRRSQGINDDNEVFGERGLPQGLTNNNRGVGRGKGRDAAAGGGGEEGIYFLLDS